MIKGGELLVQDTRRDCETALLRCPEKMKVGLQDTLPPKPTIGKTDLKYNDQIGDIISAFCQCAKCAARKRVARIVLAEASRIFRCRRREARSWDTTSNDWRLGFRCLTRVKRLNVRSVTRDGRTCRRQGHLEYRQASAIPGPSRRHRANRVRPVRRPSLDQKRGYQDIHQTHSE
jgi:hypothetical protein